jgi:hypothetical protein
MSVTFTFNVTDVNVYPFIDAPIVVKPVITGASGQYVVGTFGPSVGYQLYISGGEQPGHLTPGAPYYATANVTSTQPPSVSVHELETHVVHFEGKNSDGQFHFGFVQTFGRHAHAPTPDYETADAG